MNRLSFTDGLFPNKKYSRKKLPLLSTDDSTEEFIEELSNELAPPGSDLKCVILNRGGIMIVLVFEANDDEIDDDGELVDGVVAINLLGTKWMVLPGMIGDWILDQYLTFITETMEDFEEE